MKCHYEVLNVARDADNAEIKSAYKKLALKWHPDKNLDDTEIAKEQFQLVQQAYEILSDKQERAWYDNHREQILRGANSEFEDNSLDVFQYFTTTCFKGYSDDEKGFYTVYRNIFEQIAKEDMEFCEKKEEFCEIPVFGNSESDYESTVGPFYAYWMSYSTKKSYVWLDPHDIKDIRDRRLLKLIEKENKKIRLKAKKERNEEIRNLVAFVRKRDKRIQKYNKVLEERALQNRKKHEELRKQKILETRQLNASGTQAEWSKFENVTAELDQIEKNLAETFGDSNTDDEYEEDNNLYCVACNKLFKTHKSFENHESSKKHKENIEKLKETMMAEEEDFLSDSIDDESSFEELSENEVVDEPGDEEVEEQEDEVKPKDVEDAVLNENGDENDTDDDESIPEIKQSKRKNKKVKNVLRVEISDHDEDPIAKKNSDDDFDFSSSKKSKKKTVKKNKLKTASENVPLAENPESKTHPNNEAAEEDDTIISAKNRKKNKRKQKKDKNETIENEEVDTNHNCVSCKAIFSSKNKLFEHLKKTGHSVYLPSGSKSRK